MGYTQAKAPVNNIKVQVHQQPQAEYVKDERIISNGSQKTNLFRSGASLIETILSVSILLVMSFVFKIINAKQREFDQLEDKRR